MRKHTAGTAIVPAHDTGRGKGKPAPGSLVARPLRSPREREGAILGLRMALRCGWDRRVVDLAVPNNALKPLGLSCVGEEVARGAHVRSAMAARLSSLDVEVWPPDDGLQRNLRLLGQVLHLRPSELAILRLGLIARMTELGQSVLDEFDMSRAHGRHAISAAVGLPIRSLREMLSSRGRLVASGLLEVEPDEGLPFRVDDFLVEALSLPQFSAERFLRSVARPSPGTGLTVENFTHVEGLELLRRHLKAAVQGGRKGVNILLHGAPGTGKTELVRALAKDAALSLLEVPSEDKTGDPLDGAERLKAFRLCQRLMDGSKGQLLLFDEVEDVFGRRGSGESAWMLGALQDRPVRKRWLNELLETNPVPAVWVSNSIDAMDAAYLRRFDLVLECRPPGRAARTRIVAGQFRRGEISAACASRLADIEGVAPAHLARAARVVRGLRCRNVGERDAAVLHLVQGSLKAMGVASALPVPSLPEHYDPAFLHTTTDLDALAEGLRRTGVARLCLYGPPGTGKTAFAHYLGRRLDRPVQVRRGSDLLSQWLGETEKRIAAAFEQARRDGAILVIDEADGFLRDRAGASRSWEVTQVNELLTQLEAFEGVFIASTNLVDSLDPAALRRFDFKLKFDYLRREQRRALVRRVTSPSAEDTAEAQAWAALDRLSQVTPGDVANVLRQCAVTGQVPTVSRVVALLEAEQAMKPGARQRGIGFTA